MIKVLGDSPKQLEVSFGDGSVTIGSAIQRRSGRQAVVLVDAGACYELGKEAPLPIIQDRPCTVSNLSRRAVVLSFPQSEDGITSINLLIEKLEEIKSKIFDETEPEEE